MLERAASMFDGGADTSKDESAQDLKVLHAKIGQQALEIDFLSGALPKAGLLSASQRAAQRRQRYFAINEMPAG